MFKDFLYKSKILSNEDQNKEDLDFLYQSFDINPDTISNLFEESDIEKKYFCENIFSTKNKEQIKSKILFNISKTIPQLFLEKDIYNIINKKIDDENIENILNQNLNVSDKNNALQQLPLYKRFNFSWKVISIPSSFNIVIKEFPNFNSFRYILDGSSKSFFALLIFSGV